MALHAAVSLKSLSLHSSASLLHRGDATQAVSLSRHGAPTQQRVVRLPAVQPVAKRICDLTGKIRNNGYKVSFSNHRTKKLQQPNLQYKRLWWEEGNAFVRLRICTRALKTVERKGLAVMAKDAGIDLRAYVVKGRALSALALASGSAGEVFAESAEVAAADVATADADVAEENRGEAGAGEEVGEAEAEGESASDGSTSGEGSST